MRKYRIKKSQCKFYPQWASVYWGWWHYYKEFSIKDSTYYFDVFFDTYDDAKDFILKQKDLDKVEYYYMDFE